MREIVADAALGRPATDVTFPAAGWTGTSDTDFIVTVQAIRRATEVQTLFVGGVARKVMADDVTRKTSFVLNDLSNGSGVAISGNGEAIECEEFSITKQAKADIIWLIDESGSTDHFRQQIVDDAANFFAQAQAAGLDFRMGVTDLHAGRMGRFASRQVGGTGDRWLLPSDEAEFEMNVFDPSGPDPADGGTESGLTQLHDAMVLHTPRNNADPQMVREDAQLIFIIATDEKPQEIKDAGILGEGNVQPSPAQQTQIRQLHRAVHRAAPGRERAVQPDRRAVAVRPDVLRREDVRLLRAGERDRWPPGLALPGRPQPDDRGDDREHRRQRVAADAVEGPDLGEHLGLQADHPARSFAPQRLRLSRIDQLDLVLQPDVQPRSPR